MKTALDAARTYLGKLPPAISGAGGHDATLYAACCLIRLGLPDADAMTLLREYNRRCKPLWKEKELAHKLRDARRVAGSEVRTCQRPKAAVRVVWKLERRAVNVAEPVAIQAPPAPAPAEPQRPEKPTPEAAASLPPDCLPWILVARQILAGEFDGADRSTAESLTLGLHRIPHPTCREALARLQAKTKAKA